MTDNETKKALECYRNSKIIQVENSVISIGDILDLVNRLEAEVDDLKRDTIPKLQDALKRANGYGIETDKENQQLKADVERLQQYYDDMQSAIYEFREDHAKVKFFKKEIKSEAVKEFAERLKEKTKQINITIGLDYDVVFVSEIDNLVKEMVGESK